MNNDNLMSAQTISNIIYDTNSKTNNANYMNNSTSSLTSQIWEREDYYDYEPNNEYVIIH